MKRILLFQVFLIFCFTNIQGQTVSPSNLFIIPLATNMSNQKVIGLKEIAENIEYVKLEYRPECALGRIQWLIGSKDYFFVSSINSILQFSRSGNYIKEIGKIGRGPGEYPSPCDVAIDELNHQIYILPNYLRMIQVYDFNGKFVKSIRLQDRYIESFDLLENGLIVLQSGMNSTSLLSTEIIDQQGKKILQFNSRVYNKNDGSIAGKLYNVTYKFNNDLFVKECKNDTVYKVTSKGLMPYFIYDFGKLKPPVTKSSEESKYTLVFRIFETNSYIFTFFFYKESVGVARYDKTTKEVFVSTPFEKKSEGITNDFDFGLNFYLNNVPKCLKTNQKEFILPLSPNSLYEFRNNPRIIGNFKTLINQFKDNDNPVIMVINLK